jgi:hypothetical protein
MTMITCPVAGSWGSHTPSALANRLKSEAISHTIGQEVQMAVLIS